MIHEIIRQILFVSVCVISLVLLILGVLCVCVYFLKSPKYTLHVHLTIAHFKCTHNLMILVVAIKDRFILLPYYELHRLVVSGFLDPWFTEFIAVFDIFGGLFPT